MVLVGEVVGTIKTDCSGVIGTGLEVVEVEAVDAVEFLVAKLPPLALWRVAHRHWKAEWIVVGYLADETIGAQVYTVVSKMVALIEMILRLSEATPRKISVAQIAAVEVDTLKLTVLIHKRSAVIGCRRTVAPETAAPIETTGGMPGITCSARRFTPSRP